MPRLPALVRNLLERLLPMNAHALTGRSVSVAEVESLLALGAGAVLLIAGAMRRSTAGACLAASATPLLYRGFTGRWPAAIERYLETDDATALSGRRAVHVRESIRVEVPVNVVYRLWRRLANLPKFMTHLESVTEASDGHSHWVAAGPAGMAVEWDAEIIREVENKRLAWRSLPGSDVVSSGSVRFDEVRNGRTTQVSVELQYAPPAGKAGAAIAWVFGRAPSQTIREDLRHFKQWLETGEVPRATATS